MNSLLEIANKVNWKTGQKPRFFFFCFMWILACALPKSTQCLRYWMCPCAKWKWIAAGKLKKKATKTNLELLKIILALYLVGLRLTVPQMYKTNNAALLSLINQRSKWREAFVVPSAPAGTEPNVLCFPIANWGSLFLLGICSAPATGSPGTFESLPCLFVPSSPHSRVINLWNTSSGKPLAFLLVWLSQHWKEQWSMLRTNRREQVPTCFTAWECQWHGSYYHSLRAQRLASWRHAAEVKSAPLFSIRDVQSINRSVSSTWLAKQCWINSCVMPCFIYSSSGCMLV